MSFFCKGFHWNIADLQCLYYKTSDGHELKTGTVCAEPSALKTTCKGGLVRSQHDKFTTAYKHAHTCTLISNEHHRNRKDKSRLLVWASMVAHWVRIHLPPQGSRSIPWARKIPHATEQLSPWATTPEPPHSRACEQEPRARAPQLLKPAHPEPRSATRGDAATRNLHTTTERSPSSPQLEKTTSNQDPAEPNSVKEIPKINKKLTSLGEDWGPPRRISHRRTPSLSQT